MFEVGESYRFKMWRPGKDGGEIIEHPHCMVISVEHPLIKIRGFDGEQIINTACIALRERSLTNGRRTSSFTKSKTMRGFCWGGRRGVFAQNFSESVTSEMLENSPRLRDAWITLAKRCVASFGDSWVFLDG
jgi:hypothetical protein